MLQPLRHAGPLLSNPTRYSMESQLGRQNINHLKTATVITMPSCQVSNSLGCWVKYSLRATKAKLRRYETTGSITRAYQSSSTMPHFTLRFSDEFHHMHGYRHHYKIYKYRTWRTAIPSSWRIKGWDWKTMTFLLNLTPWEWIAEILHDPLDESSCIYLWKKTIRTEMVLYSNHWIWTLRVWWMMWEFPEMMPLQNIPDCPKPCYFSNSKFLGHFIELAMDNVTSYYLTEPSCKFPGGVCLAHQPEEWS